MEQDGEPIAIDARPSDAIALALRADCPIFVSDQVLQLAKVLPVSNDNASAEEMRRWLEGLNDEDLGRYKM